MADAWIPVRQGVHVAGHAPTEEETTEGWRERAIRDDSMLRAGLIGAVCTVLMVASAATLARDAGLGTSRIGAVEMLQNAPINISEPLPPQVEAALAREAVKKQATKCAIEITGDATPRHLDEKVRQRVLACVDGFMPAMHVKRKLREAAKQLMGAAHSEDEKQDAASIVEGRGKPSNTAS
eukprot:CAMPEP_0114111026 /NCGR_PEP_ID=MMETSP0043_2-20121206/1627_1 /TAXON_ID=464988 /ORGANISM="Hemiselmis andersenii, Strain CCMP644" /LENGTH=180 /DNA_ID=CAMNT_0001203017 /DNA_START=102 /DNA_END=640 /DNA_ORIENTATION=-